MMSNNNDKKKGNKNKYRLSIYMFVVVFGIFGTVSANANLWGLLKDLVTNFIADGFSNKSADDTALALEVATVQTAVNPLDVAKAMEQTNKMSLAVVMARNAAYTAKDLADSYRFVEGSLITEWGREITPDIDAGLSDDLSCSALADKTIIQSKQVIKDTENFNTQAQLAQLYATDPSVKINNRAARHLNSYCDITETAQGLCPLSLGGMASADTDYNTMYATDVLSHDGREAALSYILNVVDPASNKIDDCDSPVCNPISAVNQSYQALANVAQSAFVNQINDRSYFEYQGSAAGKKIKEGIEKEESKKDDNEDKKSDTGKSDGAESNTEAKDKNDGKAEGKDSKDTNGESNKPESSKDSDDSPDDKDGGKNPFADKNTPSN